MADKIRVHNDTRFFIGVLDAEKRPHTIKPKKFDMLTRDDIDSIEALGNYFSLHKLRVEDEKIAEDIGVDKNDPNNLTEADIRTRLNGSAESIRKWLETITVPHKLNEVYEVADTMDLNASKIRVLKEKNPNYETKAEKEEAAKELEKAKKVK